MITFIKMLAYQQTPETGDAFTYLDCVTTQRIDPSSLHPGELHLNAPIVFHSPLQRVTDCLAADDRQKRVVLQELREIHFSLQSLCSYEEWKKERSIIVRRRFKEAFIADTLLLSRATIEQEVQNVLRLVGSHAEAVVVSHSFRLKLIEATIKTRGEIFRDPKLIHEWIRDDHKTYDWGEGFEVDHAEPLP